MVRENRWVGEVPQSALVKNSGQSKAPKGLSSQTALSLENSPRAPGEKSSELFRLTCCLSRQPAGFISALQACVSND